METNDILNRIKLMMNYDSKKTLTENRLLVEQGQGVDIKKIYDQLRNAVYEMGTDTDMLNTAFDMISKMTNSSELTALDASMNNEPIYGGLTAKYRSLQQLLNGELQVSNCGEAKRCASILNAIPGVKATYKCIQDTDMESNSFVITYQPTQKPAENTSSEILRIAKSAPPCLSSLINNKYIKAKEYVPAEGKYPEGVKITHSNGKSSFYSIDPPLQYYYETKLVSKYTCEGNIVKPTKFFNSLNELLGIKDEKSAGTGKEGPTGNSKSGNKTPYPWKDSPAIADVQSGKLTIVSGMRGDSVIEIQNLLNASGAKLNPDGKFGRRTSKALIAFQNKSGTTRKDGVVDADTYNKLKGGGGTDEFATTDVEGKFTDSQSAVPVSQLVAPKSGEGTPENQSAGKFT